MSYGWIGVDFDGTLAEYKNGWMGEFKFGEPIPKMLERVKGWLANGIEVRIVTARVSEGAGQKAQASKEEITKAIQDWTEKHLGVRLAVTCQKDFNMIELWDDRCVQVQSNTGLTVREALDFMMEYKETSDTVIRRGADGSEVRYVRAKPMIVPGLNGYRTISNVRGKTDDWTVTVSFFGRAAARRFLTWLCMRARELNPALEPKLPVDENFCHTLPDGSCVGGTQAGYPPCIHEPLRVALDNAARGDVEFAASDMRTLAQAYLEAIK